MTTLFAVYLLLILLVLIVIAILEDQGGPFA